MSVVVLRSISIPGNRSTANLDDEEHIFYHIRRILQTSYSQKVTGLRGLVVILCVNGCLRLSARVSEYVCECYGNHRSVYGWP